MNLRISNFGFRGGLLFLLGLAIAGHLRAASLAIDSLSGPVTQNEINSFITYIQSQTPPPTPWGPLTGTGHNDWADGYGGRDLEAMGEMFEVSSNLTILNLMISWADACVSQRNDLMSATNGGQRVLWTGLIDKVWCPNWPTDSTDNQYLYCGCETEDLIGHLAFCAKLILQTPALWNTSVPDGNPYGYGVTYFQRATNYLAKCDEANDEYFLKWFIQAGANLIVPPTNSAWTALNENVTAINRQMMFTSGFQRLAEAHEIWGDSPARVAQYDAIVQAATTQCLTAMTHYEPYTVNGQQVYNWGYYPTSTSGTEATEIHAEYDIIGLWRAFNRSTYGFTLPPLVPFGNTMNQVIYLGTNTFAGNVDGSGGVQSPIYSGWVLPADWNPQVYTTVAGAAYSHGWYSGSADIAAGMLFMKNRRYLEFSVTPSPASQTVAAGSGTAFTLAVAPMGGFTNAVNLAVVGLPVGATAGLSSTSVLSAALSFASTNVTLSIATSNSTPAGAYTLNIIGTSGSVSHTNSVNLVIGLFALSASPGAQTVSAGNSTLYTVGVTTNGGFHGSVSFGVSGLPANASASFSPSSLTNAGNAILSVTAAGTTPPGNYTPTITGTNGTTVASKAVALTVLAAAPIWTGGSSSGNDWSDATNWGGVALAPGVSLIFNGSVRLNNTNDTAAATAYSNVVFTSSAGAFVLNGNPIALAGSLTNNSANTETINFGLNFSNSFTCAGAGGPLIISGGLTNRLGAPGTTTLTLTGAGQLANRLASASTPGGTNILLLADNSANWTLLAGAAPATSTVPWVFEINAGTFSFGSSASAPNLTSTTGNNSPNDHQVGAATGAVATFNMVNGTLTTSGRFDTALASDSTGIINQTGGTLNIGSQFQGANGSNPGEVSLVTVSGGTMNIGAAASPTDPFYVASRGTGTLTIGGSGTVSCGRLDISRNAYGNTVSSAGAVNLNGGTLSVTSVTNVSANQQTGGTPTAAFNFNGGTLVAKAGAAFGFFQGSAILPVTPITATVEAGGAFIDDGGNSINIAEPLQHDATLGTQADGGLTKLNTGTLTLTANCTYNGATLINAGTLALTGAGSITNSDLITIVAGATLDASGRTDGTLTVAAGQTLTGSGTIKGSVILGNGAALLPGSPLGTLVMGSNLSLSNGSVTTSAINKSAAPSNAVAQVAGSLIYGGTLVITNLGPGAFSPGDSLKLFSAANYSGSFAKLTPVIPGLDLAWGTNSLTNGTLTVVSSPTAPPRIGAFKLSGGNMIISGTNGVPDWPYCVLVSTNLALPASQWLRETTNAFDAAGNFMLTNPVNTNALPEFYRLQMQ